MDAGVKIVTLDWRKFGDFSAVGQLTQKIFSAGRGIEVHPLQCLDDGVSCNVFRRRADGGLDNPYGRKLGHDAVLHHVRKLDPDALYVRLSPHKGTLELACKLAAALPDVPLIVHYMDKPSFKGMAETRAGYLAAMYRFLALRADSVYTIHDSSLPWLQQEYGREARVLANFIARRPERQHDLQALKARPLQISYFGSIDRKMNAGAIASTCRAVSNLPWVNLSVWSNSGIWGEVKEICEASSNIQVSPSNLDEAEFAARLAAADLLLLPYNLDPESLDFLKHSFSNKFVDYLEAGGVILCLGSREIPTVAACRSSGLSLVFESEAELAAGFASREAFLSRLEALDLSRYGSRIEPLQAAQKALVDAFFQDIKSRAAARRAAPSPDAEQGCGQSPGQDWTGEGLQERQLAFLIRRKFYDLENGEQQSLAASLMAQQIRAKGYLGFDYEV